MTTAEFLCNILADGPLPAAHVLRAAHAAGLSRRDLNAAARLAGVDYSRRAGRVYMGIGTTERAGIIGRPYPGKGAK